ncbi:Na+/Pi symporter [Beauveria asiatica]|uniref:Phosphate transporter n=1 Tax=Beauveria asiatica TaxID=1069075 RepID=A0AAW0RPP1_9HYPO
MSRYNYIFILTTIFASLDAWNIGANDVANSFASSVSSRSLTLKQAMVIASFCEFAGSVSVGDRVTDTLRTKIVDPHLFDDAPQVLLLAMMCAIMASSVFLTVATRYGMPVSTTHSVIGGLIGTATASVGIGKVNWGLRGASQVFLAWIIAPGIAGTLGATVFFLTKRLVLIKRNSVRRAFWSIPFFSFLTFGAVTMLLVWKGIRSINMTTTTMLVVIFSAAGGGALLHAAFVMPYLWVRIIRQDWTLKWYHAIIGPFLLRRDAPPPTPHGFNKPVINDYYRGHLTQEELAYVRASETLLQSVQMHGANGPSELDKDDDLILPPAAQDPPMASRPTRCASDSLVPRRPEGSWTSFPVITWRINRILLRGIEKDVISMQKRNAVLNWDLEDMHSRAPRFDNRAEYMFSSLQILTAAAASFTHGANDVSNAIAPFSTALDVWSHGVVNDQVEVPIWVLCFGGGAIVLGLLTYGYHVMRTLGNRLTLISPTRGFCMELATALTVIMATRLRLPVSTTQCITGATVGVGLANGDWRCINPKLVGWIYMGWDWRVWLEQDGNPISFWHDIPLFPQGNVSNIINMYVEIPRWTDAKIETKRNEPLNPIFHDDKKKKPRFVFSVWPHKTYPFNYGSIPQTWEDSTVVHNFTGYVGDNDPMDIFDISSLEPPHVGQLKQVKVLGGLAMIDDNTTDWKVIAIDVKDPIASKVGTVDDLEVFRPGSKKAFYDWFVYYKVIKGSGKNYIHGDKFQDPDTMLAHILESNEFWLKLMRGQTKKDKINRDQTSNPRWCKTFAASSNTTTKFGIPAKSNILPPAARPSQYDGWYYLDKDFNIAPGQVIEE